jgi:hypothetical protein
MRQGPQGAAALRGAPMVEVKCGDTQGDQENVEMCMQGSQIKE